jgi:TonB-dependent receptor
VHVRYAVDHDTILRAAFTRTLARPDFGDLVPYEIRDGDTVSKGNPLLKPTVAWNADVAVERYLHPLGHVSAALFTKRLGHNIYTFEAASTANGQPITLTQPENGEAATIAGLELSFQQQLRMLPAPFDSLGVYATYTRSTSKARYPRRTTSLAPLSGQTPHEGNAAVSYERGGFSGRLAMNFHRGYLSRVGATETDDEKVAGRIQVDLSMTQQVGRHAWIALDADNLTDAARTTFGPSPSRPTAIERFGRYGTLGLRLRF